MSPRTVGSLEPCRADAVPTGALVMDGREIHRDAYPELWEWTVEHDLIRPGIFGPGDGATTFRLPDIPVLESGPPPGAGPIRIVWIVWAGR
jgi:hypothetical protein